MASFKSVLVVATLALLGVSVHGGAPPTPETVYNDAGYITVHNNTRHLFYWYFESRNDPANDPFVLWMSGACVCVVCTLFLLSSVSDVFLSKPFSSCIHVTYKCRGTWLLGSGRYVW